MSKSSLLIVVVATLLGGAFGCLIGYDIARAHITEKHREQAKVDMLKDNIDQGHVFEGTLTYFGQRFYENESGLLQADGIKESACKQLSRDGYNCRGGTLVTKLNEDPAETINDLVKRAEIAIAEANSVAK